MTVELRFAAAAAADLGRGIVRMAPQEMAALGLRPGDAVRLTAARATHARVLPGRAGHPPGALAAAPLQLANAGGSLGAPVQIAPAALPSAERIALRTSGRSADPAKLKSLLEEQPVTEGDALFHDARGEIRVAACAPAPAARITAETRIAVEGATPLAGIGGLGPQVARLREMVELPMARPDLFARLGLEPPRGVLFTGPPGSGKTLLARRFAEAVEARFFLINGPEIVAKHYGESESRLREVFDQAERQAPALIFIDEIDAIAPKRDALSGEKQLERRVVAQLLTLMDGLEARGRVVVMAATNLPHALDPALRRPGRFDRELAFGAPDRTARAEILAVHLADAPLAADVDLAGLAAGTHGFVGADLAALAREAGLAALARLQAQMPAETIPVEAVEITAADLDAARTAVGPSALREMEIERPETGWSDIGGLGEAKAALTEAVLWPLTHRAAFDRLGLKPSSGILLAGAPGGGKTLLARALAAESGVNFIPVRGSRLLSQFLGEAERAVAEIFAKARHAAPAIVFIDELDALAPVRGRADPALERVVATLLTEIDGLEPLRDVLILAATNRPSAIDPALLRPGRFDRVIEIAPPDAAERAEILAVHTRRLPLAPKVSLDALAARSEGMSGADLAALCQRAAREALRRGMEAGALDDLTVDATAFDAAFSEHLGSRSAARLDRP